MERWGFIWPGSSSANEILISPFSIYGEGEKGEVQGEYFLQVLQFLLRTAQIHSLMDFLILLDRGGLNLMKV